MRRPGYSTTNYSEDAGTAFAIYADVSNLSLDQGRELAQQIADRVLEVAEYRASYLPHYEDSQ